VALPDHLQHFATQLGQAQPFFRTELVCLFQRVFNAGSMAMARVHVLSLFIKMIDPRMLHYYISPKRNIITYRCLFMRILPIFCLLSSIIFAPLAKAQEAEVAVSIKPLHSLVAGVMEGAGTPTL